MAAPGTPTGVAVKPGPNPGEVIVTCTAVVSVPVVATYKCYIYPKTGVDSTSAYRASKISTKPKFKFSGKVWRDVYATITATNADGTSADATEASGKGRR